MNLFSSNNKPPHILHPDVLHWKEGDEIIARNVTLKGPISKINAFETGRLNVPYIFKGITSDGFIIVEDVKTSHLHKVDFARFIKRAKNTSFINRTILQDLDHSKEYKELLGEFQKAYKELEDSDKSQKLLS